ncbi:MAG TPA: tetratricopeptide repeat protein, partial [Planctomycetota bacterium]|nr:tetratricopeptide repeat protein [Planctomycetota bacterium]
MTALSLAACSSRPATHDPAPAPVAAPEPDRTPPQTAQPVKAPAQPPGDAETPRLRGLARLEAARQAADKGGDFEALGKAAIQDFDEAVKADPRSAGARAGRGEARAALIASRMPGGDFTGRGDLETAIADYTEAIRLEPDRAAYYAGRAFARQKLAVARFFARIAVGELF